MISYYCIVHVPGVQDREIAVIQAADDATAVAEAHKLAARWPGHEVVVLYEGERTVTVLANPSLGFSVVPLDLPDVAA